MQLQSFNTVYSLFAYLPLVRTAGVCTLATSKFRLRPYIYMFQVPFQAYSSHEVPLTRFGMQPLVLQQQSPHVRRFVFTTPGDEKGLISIHLNRSETQAIHNLRSPMISSECLALLRNLLCGSIVRSGAYAVPGIEGNDVGEIGEVIPERRCRQYI